MKYSPTEKVKGLTETPLGYELGVFPNFLRTVSFASFHGLLYFVDFHEITRVSSLLR